MKRLVTLLLLTITFFFLLSKTAYADEGWSIENFASAINVGTTGETRVTENIAVDFSLQKHGILRTIPTVYEDKNNQKTYTEIKILAVTANGNQVKYSTTQSEGYLQIRIGDPDQTITGEQNYQIDYSIKGILTSQDSYDEIYWNVTGNAWGVPIKKATASVRLPSEGIVQIACYQGSSGSTETCEAKKESDQEASFAASRELGPNEGLTVAVGYTKALVPIIVVPPPKSVVSQVFEPLNLGIFFLIFALGASFIFWLWWRGGRDFWWRTRFIDDPLARMEVKPVGGHETIVVEYDSPERLRPAEIGALLDEKADTIDVTATLIDLANRGYLTIAEEAKKWAFGSTDYILTKKQVVEEGLLKYEKELLDRLFETGDSVSMSALKTKFYKDLAAVKDKLYEDMIDKKFFLENPNSVRTRYTVAAFVIGISAGVLVWFGFTLQLAAIVSFGAGFVAAALVLLITAQFMPRRTALGRQIYLRALGYKMFVERAEKYRQQFFERKNLFNDVLPYAIVFGVTEKFAKAFAEMGLEPPQPSWYSGTGAFNAAVFGVSMASFSNSFSTAMASTPSHSGSGGGGSSGGGFGGGGGGSW